MNFIFGIKKMKTITVSQKSQKLFKKRKHDIHTTSTLMKLNIMTKDDKPEEIIKKVFNNALETII